MKLSIVLACALLCVCPTVPAAQWIEGGSPVSSAPDIQLIIDVVPDAVGGLIAAWEDSREGDADVYVQRVDAGGNVLWRFDGLDIDTDTGFQFDPRLLPDGNGGVIIVWAGNQLGDSDIYANYIDKTGSAVWGKDPVEVCTAAGNQLEPEIAAFENSDAIIVWRDERGADPNIYAQRINKAGVTLWGKNGVQLYPLAASQRLPRVVAQESGGAIVAWVDSRNIGTTVEDIYSACVQFNGTLFWLEPVVVENDVQDYLEVVGDGHSGAVFAWADFRGGNWDIYSQRIDSTGTRVWPVSGVSVVDEAGIQRDHTICGDDAGGAIIAWDDGRGGTSSTYIRRVTAAGSPQWLDDGIEITASASLQGDAYVVADGFGGAVVAWIDDRSGGFDIFGQRFDGNGNRMWTALGAPVTEAPGNQLQPMLAPDGAGGALVAWRDVRNGTSTDDVYAMRVESQNGGWGMPEPVMDSVVDVAGDQGGSVHVNWLASGYDVAPMQDITHYSVWRATGASAVTKLYSTVRPRLVQPQDIGPDFHGPAVLVEETVQGPLFWEWLSNEPAAYLPGYSYTAATSADSTAGGPALNYFRVTAHTSDPFRFWHSQMDSGYSVDNIAPAAPVALSAQRTNGDNVELSWLPGAPAEPDFKEYWIYRGTSQGFALDPAHRIGTSLATFAMDNDAMIGVVFYYKVVAVDIHDNASPPSNEASTEPNPTGINDHAPSLTALRLLPTTPNPFSTATLLRIGVPATADVDIDVFDVAGRRVFHRHLESVPRGWHTVTFRGRDDGGRALPSGVYLTRVTAVHDVQTQKMVIQR